MSDVFTIDGQSLEAAGVSSLSFEFTNQEADTCSLKLVDGGSPRRQWRRDTKVSIQRNGMGFFTGWVSPPVAADTAGDTGLDITISGVLYLLSRIPFARTFLNKKYTSLTLFMSAEGRLQNPREAMQELLAAAQQASGNAFAIGTLNPANMPGTPAPEWVEGEYCDVVARKIAAWCPDSVIWFDYSGGFPILHWMAPGARRSHSFTKGAAPMTADSVNFDSLMAPDAVVIRYDNSHTELQPFTDVVFEDTYPPGAQIDTQGAALLTLGAADYIGVPFAQQLYNMGRQFKWAGQITTEAQFIDIKPGDFITINGRSEMAGSMAVVQQVSVSAFDMAYTITFGAPKQLGLSDLRDLFWYLQNGTQTAKADEVLTTTPWQVYQKTLTVAPFGKAICMAPGNVLNGATSVVPEWLGTPLDAVNPPSERFTEGYRREFYLRVEWEPEADVYAGYDSLSNYHEIYRVKSSGAIVTAVIQSSRNDNVAPRVDILTGEVVENGIFYFPIALASVTNGELRVTQYRSADLSLYFVPPNNLYLLGE